MLKQACPEEMLIRQSRKIQHDTFRVQLDTERIQIIYTNPHRIIGREP
jgi:hypothetical protein